MDILISRHECFKGMEYTEGGDGWWRKRQTDKDRTTDFSISLLFLDMLSL